MRDSQRTIQAVLEAAQRVVLAKGIAGTTLDEVAREASISKGGVLHHFPNKEAILIGLLESLINRFEAEIEEFRSKDPEPRGAFTRAFLQATLKPDTHCINVFSAIRGAFYHNPALLALHRESNGRWQRKVEEDGIDPVRASIIRFAAGGLLLASAHGAGTPSEDLRTAIIDSLFAFSRAEGELHQTFGPTEFRTESHTGSSQGVEMG